MCANQIFPSPSSYAFLTHKSAVADRIKVAASSASLDAGSESNLGIGAKQDNAVQVIERSPWRSAPAALRSLIRIRRDLTPKWTKLIVTGTPENDEAPPDRTRPFSPQSSRRIRAAPHPAHILSRGTWRAAFQTYALT